MKIIAAALKVQLYTGPETLDTKNVVIAGARHADCYNTLFELAPYLAASARNEDRIIEGFITNSPMFTFLDRQEAYLEARQSRQLSTSIIAMKEEKGEKELYSEDLY